MNISVYMKNKQRTFKTVPRMKTTDTTVRADFHALIGPTTEGKVNVWGSFERVGCQTRSEF